MSNIYAVYGYVCTTLTYTGMSFHAYNLYTSLGDFHESVCSNRLLTELCYTCGS